MLLEQRFERAGELTAHALVSARFVARSGGRVRPADIVALTGNTPMPANVPEYARRWNAEQARWRADQTA